MSTEKFLNEMRGVLLGSEVVSSSWGAMIKPTPGEVDAMTRAVRDMFAHGGWKVEETK
jgi:hypothetical protein